MLPFLSNSTTFLWCRRLLWKVIKEPGKSLVWPTSCTRTPGDSSHPPLSLDCAFNLPFSFPEAASRIQPWDNNVVMKWSVLCTWLNPGKTSVQTSKVLMGRCRNILVQKFILLIKPATYQCRVICPPFLRSNRSKIYFLDLSLPSVNGVSLRL